MSLPTNYPTERPLRPTFLAPDSNQQHRLVQACQYHRTNMFPCMSFRLAAALGLPTHVGKASWKRT